MEASDPRLRALQAEIASRLRPVCEGWPDELFHQLVQSIAAITFKYDHSSSAFIYDRRATERMIAEMKHLVDKGADSPEKR